MARKSHAAAMRRSVPLLLVLLAACSPESGPDDQVWSDGRDGLCLAGAASELRAGLVTYGKDDANCTLSGAARREGNALTITPAGDAACNVTVTLDGERAIIGDRLAACSYYCGPGADYAGRMLERTDRPARSVTDFAGDPLC